MVGTSPRTLSKTSSPKTWKDEDGWGIRVDVPALHSPVDVLKQGIRKPVAGVPATCSSAPDTQDSLHRPSIDVKPEP